MHDTPAAEVETVTRPRRRRLPVRLVLLGVILLLLFGVPWWTIVGGAHWPTAVTVVGTAVFAAALLALPVAMTFGHGRRHLDRAAVLGDALLGAVWVFFNCSVLGQLLELGLALGGVAEPVRSRTVAVAVLTVAVLLLGWGHREAMKVPRVRRVDVPIAGLGRGMDGVTLAVLTDTHYGPIDRARWSAAVVDRVNALGADVVCHVGDIADGTVAVREPQASPLAGSGPRWPGCTSPATTSTSAMPGAGSTT